MLSFFAKILAYLDAKSTKGSKGSKSSKNTKGSKSTKSSKDTKSSKSSENAKVRPDQTSTQTTPSSPPIASSPNHNLLDPLQREIRAQRKFSIAEAIGREGGSFMKGESAIPRPLRATTEINQFITAHISDPTSALSTTLQAWAKDDIRVSRQLDRPLMALAQIIDSLLSRPTTFSEFARQVAIAHSHLTGDPLHFQPLGQPPHPQAHYTHDSLRMTLLNLLKQLPPLNENQESHEN